MLIGLLGVIAGLLAVGALQDERPALAGIHAITATVLLAFATLTWRRGSAGWPAVAGLAVIVTWAAALGVVLIAVVALALGAAMVVSLVSRSADHPR
jgi:hypothetical protein